MGITDRRAILLFAKYPTPGRVKSRLTPVLAPDRAAAIHSACMKATWRRLCRVRNADPILVHSPDDAGNALAELLDGQTDHPRWPQGDGDLGERLERAFECSFDTGYGQALAVGCDSPTMTTARLEEAFDVLRHEDVVMGPTDDGGYYLVGLSTSCGRAVFQDVQWGSDQVAEQTRTRAHEAGLRLGELPRGFDIDYPQDLERAIAELEGSPDDDIATTLLGELHEALSGDPASPHLTMSNTEDRRANYNG